MLSLCGVNECENKNKFSDNFLLNFFSTHEISGDGNITCAQKHRGRSLASAGGADLSVMR